MPDLTVSRLARATGVSADTIRFYEREGLLPPPPRSTNGYRMFDDDAIERIRFIKGGQAIGLRLRDVRELLEVRDRGLCPCGHAESLTKQRIAEIDEEILALRAVRRQLVSLSQRLPERRTADRWMCDVAFAEAWEGGDPRGKARD